MSDQGDQVKTGTIEVGSEEFRDDTAMVSMSVYRRTQDRITQLESENTELRKSSPSGNLALQIGSLKDRVASLTHLLAKAEGALDGAWKSLEAVAGKVIDRGSQRFVLGEMAVVKAAFTSLRETNVAGSATEWLQDRIAQLESEIVLRQRSEDETRERNLKLEAENARLKEDNRVLHSNDRDGLLIRLERVHALLRVEEKNSKNLTALIVETEGALNDLRTGPSGCFCTPIAGMSGHELHENYCNSATEVFAKLRANKVNQDEPV